MPGACYVRGLGMMTNPNLGSNITRILDDRAEFSRLLRECWTDVARSKQGLDLAGLKALSSALEAKLELPAHAFGDLDGLILRFDFNGNGILEFNEAERCMRRCLAGCRKRVDFGPTPKLQTTTLDQAGYTVIDVLSKGFPGEASLVHNANGEELLVKKFSRLDTDAGDLEEMMDEATSTSNADKCPHIAHCLEIFLDHVSVYIVSEACSGGNLATIRERAALQGIAYTEAWCWALFVQAWRGLAYLHGRALMHCNLKEHTLLLRDANYAHPRVAIADRGLCEAFASQRLKGSPCGTPGYIPPETWDSGSWQPKGDVFSLAVACAQVLMSKCPDEECGMRGIFTEFCDSSDSVALATKTKKPPYFLMNPQSPGILQWLETCLEKDPRRRPRASQVLELPWLAQPPAASAPALGVGLGPGFGAQLFAALGVQSSPPPLVSGVASVGSVRAMPSAVARSVPSQVPSAGSIRAMTSVQAIPSAASVASAGSLRALPSGPLSRDRPQTPPSSSRSLVAALEARSASAGGPPPRVRSQSATRRTPSQGPLGALTPPFGGSGRPQSVVVSRGQITPRGAHGAAIGSFRASAVGSRVLRAQ